MQYLQVEDRHNLIRDVTSGAIINVDNEGLTKAQQIAANAYNEKNKLAKLEKKVELQEQTLEEIKQLLLKVLEK